MIPPSSIASAARVACRRRSSTRTCSTSTRWGRARTTTCSWRCASSMGRPSPISCGPASRCGANGRLARAGRRGARRRQRRRLGAPRRQAPERARRRWRSGLPRRLRAEPDRHRPGLAVTADLRHGRLRRARGDRRGVTWAGLRPLRVCRDAFPLLDRRRRLPAWVGGGGAVRARERATAADQRAPPGTAAGARPGLRGGTRQGPGRRPASARGLAAAVRERLAAAGMAELGPPRLGSPSPLSSETLAPVPTTTPADAAGIHPAASPSPGGVVSPGFS